MGVAALATTIADMSGLLNSSLVRPVVAIALSCGSKLNEEKDDTIARAAGSSPAGIG